MSAQKTSTNLRPYKISGFDRTPLWNHVQVLLTSPGNGGGGNRVWTCNYCNKKVTGSYSKVKVHLLKLSGLGVESCKKISDEDYRQVKKEHDEAEANKAKEFRDRQPKKELITPFEYSDIVHYRRGNEGSELAERSQYSEIKENILGLPARERSFDDLVQGINFQTAEEASREYQWKETRVAKELTPERIVSTGSSGRNIDFLFKEDYPTLEIEEDEEENIKGREDQEDIIIEMCADVNNTTSSTPTSRAPTAAELLERRILKKTTGADMSASIFNNVEPLICGKRKLQLEINPNFCDFKEGTSSIKPDLNQFYFPAAKEYLSKLSAVDILAESAAYNIQSLQGMLAVKESLEELEAKLEVAKVSEKFYREKSEEDAKTISLMRKRIKRLEAYGKKKEEEVLDCAGYYIFKTKAELMKDFMDGKTDKWEPETDIQIWEENFAEMTPPGAEDNWRELI